MEQAAPIRTYLLVDGENIDGVLSGILERRPLPDDRPRWDRVRGFVADLWEGSPVTALFFLNSTGRPLPGPFIQALVAFDFTPIPLTGSPGQKVVDIAIQRTLEAIKDRPGNVMLASHDADFVEQMSGLLDAADRRVGVLGFREYVSGELAGLLMQGLQLFDIEGDAKAFTNALPRIRPIPIDDFDPARYL